MNRRISLIFSVCFFLCASCATEPQPAPRSGYEELADEQELEREEPSPQVDKTITPSATPPATQQGPIDLGLGDGEETNAAAIVINRPNNNDTDLDDGEQDSQVSQTYEQACEAVEQCEGLEELECEGTMDCIEQQCVYTCDPDESADGDDFEEAESLDDDEYVEEAGDDADFED